MGGTFDPVHNGHLQMALEASEVLGGVEVALMPCFQPVHKEGATSVEQRITMLRCAVAGQARLGLDLREVRRNGPSFTIDTLTELRAEVGDDSLVMVVGSDSFAALGEWKSVELFPSLCHIVVMRRPGYSLCDSLSEAELERLGFSLASDSLELAKRPNGYVLPVSATLLDISSSAVRERVRKKYTIAYLVPSEVSGYICDNSLYQSE